MQLIVLYLGNKDIVSWGKTFESSLIRCISKNQLLLAPLHYCNKNGNPNEAVTSWTNVFRDVWNQQLTKAEGGYDHPLQCLAGDLVQVDGQLQLNKTRKECNEVLDWFVCKSGSGYYFDDNIDDEDWVKCTKCQDWYHESYTGTFGSNLRQFKYKSTDPNCTKQE
ncbi:Hypothetical predicted protein [Mytilus galloprovincialis]|uniref:Uncharacterized protein n=1 Tax=Mytilus galloprovincialis TaxID=29158 RepID=A0A8B6H3E7_MYTGA|nr:Hypothetical predicted protein [Mytilus galloprovincialis]